MEDMPPWWKPLKRVKFILQLHRDSKPLPPEPRPPPPDLPPPPPPPPPPPVPDTPPPAAAPTRPIVTVHSPSKSFDRKSTDSESSFSSVELQAPEGYAQSE